MARNRIAASVMAMAFLFGSAALGQEFSGAFYVGDSNGNGIIDPIEIARAQQKYATGTADYSQVKPPFFDVVELNGNGFVDPPDNQILQYWYTNIFPARTGAPATITAVGSTTVNINPGDSAEICVEVRDSAFSGDMIATDRSGWGVNFRVDQTPGLCTTATIYGRNPWPAVKDDVGYFHPKAYEYTDRMAPNGHGRACVRVVAPPFGCEGLEIKVNTYIPSDTEALCNGLPAPCFGTVGRFPVQLDGPTFTAPLCCPPPALTVSPDPALLSDGETIQMTATSNIMGDVTEMSTWTIVSGPCTVSDTPGTKGRVSVVEGCADDTCVVQADDGFISDQATVTVTDNEAGAWDMLYGMVCSPVEGGSPIWDACAGARRMSSADGCDRGPAACTFVCSQGCSGMFFDEVCEDTPYTISCFDGADIQDSSTILDPTGGTWDALAGLVCTPRNDGQSMLSACSGARRYHSASGCDMGPASCVYDCTSGCAGTNITELCMPTTSGSYTGRCTDGPYYVQDAATVTNNEQTASVNVTPEGPVNLMEGATVPFACAATYADACSRSCNAALTDQAGCGSLSGTLYTGGGAPCTDVVSAAFDAGQDGETVTVIGDALILAPDPAAVSDGATVRFTATDTVDGDVTEDPATAWSILSGPCTVSNTPGTKGLVTAAEGCANAACVVRADYNAVFDQAMVTVTNDETTVVGIDITPEGPIVNPAPAQFFCEASYSDMCTSDCTFLADWPLGNSCCLGYMGGNGLYEVSDTCIEEGAYCSDDITATFAGFSDGETVVFNLGHAGDIYYTNPTTPLVFGSGHSDLELYDDGHFCRIAIASCAAAGASGIDCNVSLVNTDPGYYMANAFLNFIPPYSGNECAGNFNNADLYYGDTVHGIIPDGNAGASAPIAGAGMCYLEDGASYNNGFNAYFNIYGAGTQAVPQGSAKPFQILHPKAGSVSYRWELRSMNTNCYFQAELTADWFPWNPLGADGASGGTGANADDPRYDFQDFTTIYMMLADFNHKTSYSQYYGRGAWKRSNILAGYSAPGMKSGATVIAGSYFSVNVGIEFPDRIESQVMGSPSTFDVANGYEYYNTYAVFFRFDPSVVAPVSANRAGGVFAGPRNPCWTQANCNNYGYQVSQHLSIFDPVLHGGIDTANGFVYFYRQIVGNFTAYTAPTTMTSITFPYRTDAGGLIYIGGNQNKEGGHNGVAVWDRAYLDGTVPYIADPNSGGGRTQQGPDPLPEQNLLNYHFWVKPGASGKGSAIMADTFTSYTGFVLSHTGTTFYPSGPGDPTDWHSYCSPYSPGFANPTNQHCDPAQTQADYAVYHGQENVNTAIGHSGEWVYGGTGSAGSVQQWPVYIVVQ